MSRLISKGNVNANTDVGRNGEEFLLCFSSGAGVTKIEKDTLLAPVANKRCIVKVKDVKETEDEVVARVVFLDFDEKAWVPEEYLSENEYWVKLGRINSWEPALSTGSIVFGE